jgi:hypothetical protein
VGSGREGQGILNMLLKNELLLGTENTYHHHRHSALGAGVISSATSAAAASMAMGDGAATLPTAGATTMTLPGGAASTPPHSRRRPLTSQSAPTLLTFKSPRETHSEDMARGFSLLPVGETSRRLLATPRKAKRKIPKVSKRRRKGCSGGAPCLVGCLVPSSQP